MITHFLRKVKAALSDFEENNRSETRKLEIPCPCLGLLRTTPEIYCEQYGIIFSKTGTVADFGEKRSEAQKGGNFRVRSQGCLNTT